MSDEDDLILSELPDDELVLQMMDDLYDGMKDEIEEALSESNSVAEIMQAYARYLRL